MCFGPILAMTPLLINSQNNLLINSENKTGGYVMKKLLTVTAISVAVMLVIVPFASGQQEKGGAPPAQERPGAPPAQAAEKVFEGQLTKVDANAKSITVKGANQEMTFDYTDATQVTGSEKSVQGLAGKTGTDLKVSYREAAGKRTATKIETIEKGK
jgi:hypothetical protein